MKKTIMVAKVSSKRFLAIAAIFLGLTTFSCKKQEVIENKPKRHKTVQKQIDYQIKFPDTLYTDQEYSGVIRYKSILDTITTSFEDKKNNRYVLLFLTTTDRPFKDFKHVKQAIRDTFGAINNREIPFRGIKFNTPGIFYIEGIINDYVLMDINKKDKAGQEMAREIENEEWITHRVVVIDKPRQNP